MRSLFFLLTIIGYRIGLVYVVYGENEILGKQLRGVTQHVHVYETTYEFSSYPSNQ